MQAFESMAGASSVRPEHVERSTVVIKGKDDTDVTLYISRPRNLQTEDKPSSREFQVAVYGTMMFTWSSSTSGAQIFEECIVDRHALRV